MIIRAEALIIVLKLPMISLIYPPTSGMAPAAPDTVPNATAKTRKYNLYQPHQLNNRQLNQKRHNHLCQRPPTTI